MQLTVFAQLIAKFHCCAVFCGN